MGNRLTKIATRTGDAGMTGLGDGSRVEKDHLRICAMGDVDELNSQIGVLMTEEFPQSVSVELKELLLRVQHDLFDLGGELCIPNYTLLKTEQVERLDVWLNQYNAHLPPLKEFILPGGGPAAAACHLARTITRRAERTCWGLSRTEKVPYEITTYLNRLSDLLFVIARVLARHEGGSEVLWQHKR